MTDDHTARNQKTRNIQAAGRKWFDSETHKTSPKNRKKKVFLKVFEQIDAFSE